MFRNRLIDLQHWSQDLQRKPLIIRGARQVGKSTLVSLFAKQQEFDLLLLNFERNPEYAEFFVSNDPIKIIQLLELGLNRDIIIGKTLLFLDEIQATPKVLAVLRYFYEELPKLHIIVAGSLLDFALYFPTYSMPVGRISYMYLQPMGFVEFLLAIKKNKLADYLKNWRLGVEIPNALHQSLMSAFKEFMIVGGMPEAVKTYAKTASLKQTELVKQDLLATFQDDFSKYTQSNNTILLRKIFSTIPTIVGNKIKYSSLSKDHRATEVAKMIDLLVSARIASKVVHSSANGVPLAAEAKHKFYKLIFLDVGLISSVLNLDYQAFINTDIMMVNAGMLAEQWVGQALVTSQDYYKSPELHYWIREKKSSSAEIDYVIACSKYIVPIEVKAGKTGSLKSLHLFMQEKKPQFAIRLNTQPPNILNKPNIISLPLYLAEQIWCLCLDEVVV
ncbi:ATP-binding protein [thiotrophic endosymbiont of Bathymodiolus puteoserpentis (Logatchev)]|jgi:predicted AAA+ superfamily ATPase|uniref:ATP-binding protein n=1 Tax=thiotrophic endosymbiont of Bathymodiolus puteoserpentis (Logatchev) TaxID=343240 RepID=UPI0010AEFE31|nr:AAA family ATPase [thiotrophic endosymbiont of Bathymodiolus puteoserpentis (Logatchev)]CAC9632803.1 Predicted ATPase (AAA+ superfamily) [uncultured Gammaproteobacteria bacterium]CAC9634121.1 Predicted ATPase (AAA+ superfamily) [uncultured Gammaproteobacteria bacterium]SSC10676.1 Predicted ATPase (AAA+ superfamily) [thiotrophic endosymbiont of Bathymodiolus puteoserpentis (Logatchev)]